MRYQKRKQVFISAMAMCALYYVKAQRSMTSAIVKNGRNRTMIQLAIFLEKSVLLTEDLGCHVIRASVVIVFLFLGIRNDSTLRRKC